MDRRQQKTRESIFSAFNCLLSKKRYSNITVQEIIDEANVGRSTFYAHFETKDELLKAMCSEIFTHVVSDHLTSEETHDFSEKNDDTDSIITHILYHLKDNSKNIIGILTCESDEQAHARTHEKGSDCARTVIEVANLLRAMDERPA